MLEPPEASDDLTAQLADKLRGAGVGIAGEEAAEYTDQPKRREAVYAGEQLVVCRLGDELFGVDIAKVQEAIRWHSVTRVPLARQRTRGCSL
ncbi:MAG: chemotaxis protein CheW [Chloroflexi bacterium]|nr:chemotaxis protein CheW [Chloroflexota bacterium]